MLNAAWSGNRVEVNFEKVYRV